MGPTISLSTEAYKILRDQKMRGESFSDVIVHRFGKGNPSVILAYLKDGDPNPDLVDAVEKASKQLRKNLRLQRVDL